MKKKLILVFLGVFLLCGCEMKNETTFTINEDKSMELQIIAGYDDELMDAIMSMGDNSDMSTEEENDETTTLPETEDEIESDSEFDTKEYTDEERLQYLRENFKMNEVDKAQLEQNGYIFEEYQDDVYTGYIITKKVNNIDDLVGTPDFNLNDIADIENKKIFEKDGSVYKGKILFSDSEDNSSTSDMSTSGINVIYNFILNLPNEAKSSNATSTSEDGKTLTWDLSTGSIQTIEFEFEFPSILTFIKSNMFVAAGIAVVVVLIIVIIITMILKKVKSKKMDNNLNEVSKQNKNEPVIEKNDNITTIDSTQVNQIMDQNRQPEQSQNMNNQNVEQTINTQIPVQETPQVQNNVMETQMSTVQQSVQPIPQTQPMAQSENINPQPSIQPQVQNIQQDIPTQAITAMPMSQPNMTTVQPQFVTNTQSTPMINPTIVQDENTIPEIKPVVPVHINEQPVSSQNMQAIQQTNMQPTQQMVNLQPNQTIVANGFPTQNNIVQPQPDNTNINNQGI